MEKKVNENGTKKPEVIIRGWLKDVFKESHRLTDTFTIFGNVVCTVDFWGNVKPEIPVQVDGRLLEKKGHKFEKDEFVELTGEFRTKNVYDENGNKIQRRCYVFIKNIETADENADNPKNRVSIRGTLARKGKIHHCNNGDTMFDFTLDIRRSHGRRSSIPCVIWGNERAKCLAKLNRDANVEVNGWIKTRVITDSLGITKEVAEVIVDDFIVH